MKKDAQESAHGDLHAESGHCGDFDGIDHWKDHSATMTVEFLQHHKER